MKKILLLLAILLSLFSCEKKENNISSSAIEKPIQTKKQAKNKLKKWLMSGMKPQVMLTLIP